MANIISAGPSDLNVILGIITDFLHKPYNSIEDPLDLWFHQLPKNELIGPFSVGYSVGMGKASAALSIIHAVVRLRSTGEMSDEETELIGPQLAALMAIKSMTEPSSTIEEQVGKSIAKKIRVTDRPRPHALQLYTAFCKVMEFKRALGQYHSTRHRHNFPPQPGFSSSLSITMPPLVPGRKGMLLLGVPISITFSVCPIG